MSANQEFDRFYVATRRGQLLAAYALTGDLGVSAAAVRDAYVAARQHWRKVERCENAEDWVRGRAWPDAQRRSATHVRHREQGLGQDQRDVLAALARLPDSRRKTLVLGALSGLSAEQVAREVGRTPDDAARDLVAATTALSLELGCTGAAVPGRLRSLEPVVARVPLPDADAIWRTGGRRRRLRLAVSSLAAVAAVVVGGELVVRAEPGSTSSAAADVVPASPGAAGPSVEARSTTGTDPSPQDVPALAPEGVPVSPDMLLTTDALRPYAPNALWRTPSVTDNTRGTGLNTICQAARFADPAGEATFVKIFSSFGLPARRVVQTVDVAATRPAANRAFETTLGWFAGCTRERLQLIDAAQVTGIADRAQVLRLRTPGPDPRSYVLALARSGRVTVSTVAESRDAKDLTIEPAVRTLYDALARLCPADAAGDCPLAARINPVLPPASGEALGMLATADLPVLERIQRRWVGTEPVTAPRVNVAATTCDRANFSQAGARGTRTRTFLIPGSRLPSRFGLTETLGAFDNPREAKAFLALVRGRMDGCEKRDLASTVTQGSVEKRGFRGSEYALWRLTNEIGKDASTVSYWTGVARVGRRVVQVTFTPAEIADLDAAAFRGVLTRARDRLLELP